MAVAAKASTISAYLTSINDWIDQTYAEDIFKHKKIEKISFLELVQEQLNSING